MAGFGAAAAGAGGQILGSAISGITNAVIAKRQRRHEQLMADQQYDRQIKQRDYMNEYNSAKNQMARYEEAGLNPHLIYGQGTTGNQNYAPKPERPGSPYPTMPNVNIDPLGELGKYFALKNTQAQTDKTVTETNGRKLANFIMSSTLDDQIQFYNAKLKGQQAKSLTEAERLAYTAKLKELANAKLIYQNELNDMAKNRVFVGDNAILRQFQPFFGAIKQGFSAMPQVPNLGQTFRSTLGKVGIIPNLDFNNNN